jgi:hypothetical protein
MTGKFSLAFVCTLLLGCAGAQGSWLDDWTVRGVVVNKSFRPTPLSDSLGVDGIYKLEVRDEKNRVRRQMVTRVVFLRYEIGDRFDASVPFSPRLATEQIRKLIRVETKKRLVQEKIDDSPPPPATGPRDRLLSACFTQDMLPETEGF